MLTIALLQLKGGSGRTTLATNLAAAAHLDGLRTLLIDMDRQGSSLDWGASRPSLSKLEGLTVVKVDRAIALPRFKEMAKGYDVAILDGPPRLGDVTQSAAVLADVAVIPVKPGPFDFWAVGETGEFLNQADSVREQLGRGPVHRGFVVNMAAPGSVLGRQAEGSLSGDGEVLGVIHNRIAFPDAASKGEAVLTSHEGSQAAFEVRKLWRAVKGLA